MYPGGEFPQGPMGQWRLGHPELQVCGSVIEEKNSTRLLK